VIAIPARLFADEPPVTWSVASLKTVVNSADTLAPAGADLGDARQRHTLAACGWGRRLPDDGNATVAVSVAPPLVTV
jgi:hypothetical protein